MQPQGPNRYSEIYQPMREKTVLLQDQLHDIMGGDFKNPQAHVLNNHIKGLMDDIDSRKPIAGLDHRIKSIQNHLQQSKFSPNPFMDFKHFDYMHENFEDMRLGMHKFKQ